MRPQPVLIEMLRSGEAVLTLNGEWMQVYESPLAAEKALENPTTRTEIQCRIRQLQAKPFLLSHEQMELVDLHYALKGLRSIVLEAA